MFSSYARNIHDGNERKKLHKLYLARNICFAVFMALCIAVIAESLIFDKQFGSDDPSDAAMVLFLFTLLGWLGTAIASAVLFFKFRKRYRVVLLRPAVEGETPEEAEYRKKTVQTQASDRKATLWALIVLILCVTAMVVCIFIDHDRHPDSDELYALSYAGICIGVLGIFVYFFAVLRNNLKKATAASQQTPDAQQIDALQGRAPQYRLQDDRNLNTLIYLYPTPELREQAQAIRKKHGTVLLASLVAAMIAGFVVSFVVFSGKVLDRQLQGFMYPVFLAVVFATVYLSSLPFVLRLGKIEKRQKEITQNDPALQTHWQIYKAYNAFAKGKGLTIHICLALGFVLSLVLAFIFPEEVWSLFGVCPVLAGIVLHNVFLRRLRQNVIPLEREIDERNKPTPDESNGEQAMSDESDGENVATETDAENAATEDGAEQTADGEEA